MNSINLTINEYKALKEIGHGTDGKVFKYDKHSLIKIYHQYTYNIDNLEYLLSLEDKLYDKNSIVIKNKQNTSNYFLLQQ